MTSLPAEFTTGSVLAERFRIRGTRGEGGMAYVLLADHIGLRVPVAIKVLKPDFARSHDLVTRFLREARAMARIANEHVVSVMDVGTGSSGTPYFVMEYLDGTDFAMLLDANGPLPMTDAVEYALQALEGLAAAHRAGVVHRDLKPSNLFLAKRPDDFPLVKVLDFGISKHSAGWGSSNVDLTQPAAILGSPYYMSPEQLTDARSVDVRTDIWSFGVLLYELLSSELPFDASVYAVLIDAICSGEPRPLREHRPDLPAELAGVVLRCLEKDRERRFADVDELTRALTPFATSPACQVSVDRILRRRSSSPPLLALPLRAAASAAGIESQAAIARTVAADAIHDTVATGPPTFSDVEQQVPTASAGPRGSARAVRSFAATSSRTTKWLAGGFAFGIAGFALLFVARSKLERSVGTPARSLDDATELSRNAPTSTPRPQPPLVASGFSPGVAAEPRPVGSAFRAAPARSAAPKPKGAAVAHVPASDGGISAAPPSSAPQLVPLRSRELDPTNPFRRQ